MTGKADKKCVGIVGGLGALAGADVYFKFVRAMVKSGQSDRYGVLFEQHPFDGVDMPANDKANLNGRKLYVYDMIKCFEERKADSVLVPCFLSHTFLHELQEASSLTVLNVMDALRMHLKNASSCPRKLGILTSNYVRRSRLFERTFADTDYTLVYPSDQAQECCVMRAIYGEGGIKSGNINGRSVDLLHEVCMQLLEIGVDMIVPGSAEIAVVAESLLARGIPIVDTNQAYVDYALAHNQDRLPRALKVGIVGGVGPAATVDFMQKIIRNTDAQCDQDHIKLIIEHNPKIPDRTTNLIGDGKDPTIALYAACKRLEANEADLIAIPCNTAHAYVARIQPYLSISIVNMLHETIAHIARHYSQCRRVGLLATSGTIASGVYHDAAQGMRFEIIVPDLAHQDLVMNAIYGEKGVKAGYVDGECKRNLMSALEHLVGRDAEVAILGCTELPLLLESNPALRLGGREVVVLDPTEILAKYCVNFSCQRQGSAAVVPEVKIFQP